MINQNYSNILFSCLIGFIISYYYIKQIDHVFLFNFILISLILFIILHYLGPKNIEFFENGEEEEEMSQSEEEMSDIDKLRAQCSDLDKMDEENTIQDSETLMQNEEEYIRTEEEQLLKTEEEKSSMDEELSSQEEYIRNSIEEDLTEEELRVEEEKKETPQSKISDLLSDSAGALKDLAGTQGNTQINPGIGVGISPVNIYINGEKGLSVNGNNGGKDNSKKDNNTNESCSSNYYKNASRIYNNSDWVNATNSYQHEKYNYDKMSPCSGNNNSDNYLLPCIQPEANKIPQTLNNLMNTKKAQNNGEACPIEINQPWANYKTGDDNETNTLLPEGFNL